MKPGLAQRTQEKQSSLSIYCRFVIVSVGRRGFLYRLSHSSAPMWSPVRSRVALCPALRLCHRTVCLPPDPDPVQPSTCHQTLGQELGLKRQAPGASTVHKGKLKSREGTWLPLECPWQAEDQCPHIPPPTQFSIQSHSSEDTENGSLGCHLPARITALTVAESRS